MPTPQLTMPVVCTILSRSSNYCNATISQEQPCTRLAEVFPVDMLPICIQHVEHQIPSARCMAFATCGWRCFRLTKNDAPLHLCPEHRKIINTGPFPLLRLPVEVRLMIFRHVFPTSIPACQSISIHWEDVSKSTGLLAVNRQISKEASSVLYGQVLFEAQVNQGAIWCCGVTCYREPSNYDNSEADLQVRSPPKCPWEAIKRIQNLEVMVCLGNSKKPPGCIRDVSGTQKIELDDYSLYKTRDNVRKFISFVECHDSASTGEDKIQHKIIQRLCVSPVIRGTVQWRLDETLAAIILIAEPFKLLKSVRHPLLDDAYVIRSFERWVAVEKASKGDCNRVIYVREYATYRLEWQESFWQDIMSYPRALEFSLAGVVDQIDVGFENIKHMVAMVQGHHFHLSNDPEKCNAFIGLARPFHLARVAYENRDLSKLTEVRNALKQRWVEYQRAQQNESARMANSILKMFDPVEAVAIVEENQHEFIFTQVEPRLGTFDLLWPELDVRSFTYIPEPEKGDYATWDDRERRYYTKGSITITRLKTPAFVRANRPSAPWTYTAVNASG